MADERPSLYEAYPQLADLDGGINGGRRRFRQDRRYARDASNAVIASFDQFANDVGALSREVQAMTTLAIRNVEPAVKERLRVRAARNGRSMEAELRAIVAEAVGGEHSHEIGLAEAIRRRFAAVGGVDDLVIHPEVFAR